MSAFTSGNLDEHALCDARRDPNKPFVRLYACKEDPCSQLLYVSCFDQVGFLFKLAELLTKHGVHIGNAQIDNVSGLVVNKMYLRAFQPSSFAESTRWCSELEEIVRGSHPGELEQPFAACAKKLGVNLDLLGVTWFQAMEEDEIHRGEFQYLLKLKGINQAGVLAYAALVFLKSNCIIRRARVFMSGGCFSHEFVLGAKSPTAERLLRLHFRIRTHEDAGINLLWRHGDVSSFRGSPGLRMSHTVFLNGDVYEGETVVGEDGTDRRQGYGAYFYSHTSNSPFQEYRGQWVDDEKDGNGILYSRSGSVYVGEWRANRRQGLGMMYGPDSTSRGGASIPSHRYEGEWVDDLQHGLGIEQTGESVYFGQFRSGIRSGRGLELNSRQLGVDGCHVSAGGTWLTFIDYLHGIGRHASSMTSVEDTTLRHSKDLAPEGMAAVTSVADRPLDKNPTRFCPGLDSACTTHEDLLSCHSDRTRQNYLSAATFTPFRRQRQGDAVASTTDHNSLESASTDTSERADNCFSSNQKQSTDGSDGFAFVPNIRRESPVLTEVCFEGVQCEGNAPPKGLQQRSTSKANHGSLVTSGDTPLASRKELPLKGATPSRASQRCLKRAHSDSCVPLTSENTQMISCPMLWGEEEIAAFVECLGLSREIVDRVRRKRLRGVEQVLEMSHSRMSQELGLVRPLERLVVRRSLQRLLDTERIGTCGHSVRDVIADTVLNARIVPLDELTLVSRVSQGRYGKVYRGILQNLPNRTGHKSSRHHNVAVKEMLGDRRTQLYELLKEARIMAVLKHPNISSFIGVCANGEHMGKRYIISELMDCSLFDMVHRPQTVHTSREGGAVRVDVTLHAALKLGNGIGRGIVYIHDRNLVHADLKSSNVLIDITGRELVPRICDFGHAAVRPFPATHHLLGTPHWAAPEVVRGDAIGPKADVFSFGALLWEMLTKQLPHAGLSFGQVVASVGWAGCIPDLEMLPVETPVEIRGLAGDCFCFLPTERPTMRVARRHLNCLLAVPKKTALQSLLGFLWHCNE
eukprot:TRINITY_DN8198_c0_g2_i1.p1 TRINITY_DN8198_c0_g2~~TRINITY_DN8198_c0_g2_i1.p1  ORF type:complete len:1030 (-),score=88.04 TRINITY_DN8198_c0_g2_i1:182-3271(-)